MILILEINVESIIVATSLYWIQIWLGSVGSCIIRKLLEVFDNTCDGIQKVDIIDVIFERICGPLIPSRDILQN